VARIDVVMPQMGESIAEGTLSKWLKKVGDQVKRDEPMFEISTDKVDAEIPAPSTGVLAEILVTEGEDARRHECLLLVGAATARGQRDERADGDQPCDRSRRDKAQAFIEKHSFS